MSDAAPIPLYRYRLAYQRGPELRYVGHLDTQLVWERTFRRARLPLAFSQGFNPRPRFHMASALPLGCTSCCELADLWLVEPLEPVQLTARLQQAAPPGLKLQAANPVDLAQPALQTLVSEVEYLAVMMETPAVLDLPTAVASVLAVSTLPRTRRNKAYDLRPLIIGLELRPVSTHGAPPTIWMRLSAREGATGRPDEVLAELGLDPSAAHIERCNLILIPSPAS